MTPTDRPIPDGRVPDRRTIHLVTTGGTIEKIYDEGTGELLNRGSIVQRMLGELRLEGLEVCVRELMSKDSLEMTDDDRRSVLETVTGLFHVPADRPDCGELGGVVILHGTDTLTDTGHLLEREIGQPPVPIVLTGAMRPFEMKRSDALQNLTEALFAAGALPPGVYCVAHGRALRFPGVVKDRRLGTFVRQSDSAAS
jgi:L-asparaginase